MFITVLFYTLVAATVIQFCYNLSFISFLLHKNSKKPPDNLLSIASIFCAKNKANNLNKKSLAEKIDKAINLLMITSSFPIKLIKLILNFGIIVNIIYITYVLLFTFREGIGSGWSSISFQNSFMCFLLFLVMRIFFLFI